LVSEQMRLFQNSGLYSSYLHHLNSLAADATTFEERRRIFLNDRFGALHFLQPVLAGEPDAFFTNGDDALLQNYWASENGMPAGTPVIIQCERRSLSRLRASLPRGTLLIVLTRRV